MSPPRLCAAALVLALVAAEGPAAASDGLALTPPMGWNSWNRFHCDVSEQVVRDAADAMVASGMKDAGYQYVVVDDCWQGERDREGRIAPDPARFPSGMRALADYVHSRGLKFGLYSDAGTLTCATRPGSKDHEGLDARTYAEWGVDYLKYDWCHTDGQDARASYGLMSRRAAGHGPPHRLLASASGEARALDLGRRASATCGGRRATSRTAGTAAGSGAAWGSPTSSTSWRTSTRTPAPAAGTTPTCSRWATAA